jgi:hypothetical protein
MLKTELIILMEIWSFVPVAGLLVVAMLLLTPSTRQRSRVWFDSRAFRLLLSIAWLFQGATWLMAAKSIHRDVFRVSFHMSTTEWRRVAEPLWWELGYCAATSLMSLFLISVVSAWLANGRDGARAR